MCAIINHRYAGVAELADALDLGSSGNTVWVRVPPSVPFFDSTIDTMFSVPRSLLKFIFDYGLTLFRFNKIYNFLIIIPFKKCTGRFIFSKIISCAG